MPHSLVCFLRCWFRLRQAGGGHLLVGAYPLEFRRIGPNMKLNADFRAVWVCLVVLLQPSAYFTGLYPNHRIVSCGISSRALKQIDSYCSFLKSILVPFQAVADHIRQKLLAAFARLKNRAVQDRFQLAKDRLLLNLIENAAVGINHFVPNLTISQTHGSPSLPFESTAITQDEALHRGAHAGYSVVAPFPAG